MVLGNPSLGNLNSQENDTNSHWYMIWMKFSSHLHYMKNKHWNTNIWYIERIFTSRKNRQGWSFVVCIYIGEPTTKNIRSITTISKGFKTISQDCFEKFQFCCRALRDVWSLSFAPLVFLDLYYWERVLSGATNH